MLPACDNLQIFQNSERMKTSSKPRKGKGKHLLPILKRLLEGEENWLELTSTNKERYLFPGWHDSAAVGNALYYTENVTLLPQYSEEHHIWQDIQFGKASTSTSAIVHGKKEKKETLNYWMAKCNGVQKCAKCDHVLPNSCVKNNCKAHCDAVSLSLSHKLSSMVSSDI